MESNDSDDSGASYLISNEELGITPYQYEAEATSEKVIVMIHYVSMAQVRT